ncbi:Hypothetical predicted protein [Lecanosticta acicola]|uniref:Uncharacterized protein n=1 Tax=Lecanosticta acicola TaxID=111012 RepID=A0AAI8Z8V6_9PEZI|nr:Hypothetical predicted protein [Lecanosticta acicola]
MVMDDKQFQDAVRGGALLYECMSHNSIDEIDKALQKAGKLGEAQSSQSPFIDPGRMFSLGWVEGPNVKDKPEDILGSVLRDLGLSDKVYPQGSNQSVVWMQNQDKFDGKKQKPTYAHYDFWVNTKDGVVIITNAKSPMATKTAGMEGKLSSTMKGTIEAQIPKLHKMSDVVFLEYIQRAKNNKHDPKGLRYIFHNVVETESTNEVIEHVLKSKGCPRQPWEYHGRSGDFRIPPDWKDRVTVTPNEEGFKALLRSNQGAFVAWMLLQHRQQLGHKRVKQIVIYQDTDPMENGYRGPSLMLEVENVQ